MTLASRAFLVFTDETTTEAAIRAALPSTVSIRFVSLYDAFDSADRIVAETSPDVVLVACSSNPQRGLRAIGDIATVQPPRPIIALYEGNPNGFMDPAFRAGAEDLIVLPQPPDQLAFELQKVIARRRGSDGEAERGALITVLGPKGGTGKTVTSCNLAVALATAGARPVVVDLDLQFGDVGLALGLRPEKTIYELVTAGGSLDSDKLEGFVTHHRSGAHALLAPKRPDQAAAISTEYLRDLLTVLRGSYDFVIVDTAPAFSPEVIVAIDASSHLCVVGMLDALSLKDTKIGLETLAQMGYAQDDITLVLNRADTSVGISMSDVFGLLRKSPDILIPSDRAIPRALTNGETIYEADPKSGAARGYAELARRYLDITGSESSSLSDGITGNAEAATPRKRRLLRRGT
jgi:pilus assembly protein CpaE